MSLYIKLLTLVDMTDISITGFSPFLSSVNVFLAREYVRPWKTEVFNVYIQYIKLLMLVVMTELNKT